MLTTNAYVDNHDCALAAPIFVEEDLYTNTSVLYKHDLYNYNDNFGSNLMDQTQGHGMWWETTPNNPTVPLMPAAVVHTQPQALAHVEIPIDVAKVLAKLPTTLWYSPPPLVFSLFFLFFFCSPQTDHDDNNNSNATNLMQGHVWTTTNNNNDSVNNEQQQQQVDAVLVHLPASLWYTSLISSPILIESASPLTSLCFSVCDQQEHD
jgi:hypothetical protein